MVSGLFERVNLLKNYGEIKEAALNGQPLAKPKTPMTKNL